MYHVPHFKATDNADVLAFMQAHPFIILCGTTAEGLPVATHVPVLFEQRGDKTFLLAHVMRRQEHTKAFEQNPNVLAIFSGANTYVSASWYTKQQVASTWNYQAVHAKGTLTFTDDAGLHRILTRLTAQFEDNPASPALVEKMDEGYVHQNMKAIAGFEIEITSVQHIFKLSQNRDKKSFDNIIAQLQSSGKDDAKQIASAMHEIKPKLFGE